MTIIHLFLYLIGWNIIIALYGIYTAITAYYYGSILKLPLLLYSVKIIEFAIVVYFGHQILKRATFERMGLGKAIREGLKPPFQYFRGLFQRN